MADSPRTKEPRRPSRRTEHRPFSPIRDARVAAAFDRDDRDNAWVEFIMDPENPLPDWVRIGKRVAYRSNPSVISTIIDIVADPQHVYELIIEWTEYNSEGLSGRVPYKWLTNGGEPEFERVFQPV
jgi:hypothetical protein